MFLFFLFSKKLFTDLFKENPNGDPSLIGANSNAVIPRSLLAISIIALIFVFHYCIYDQSLLSNQEKDNNIYTREYRDDSTWNSTRSCSRTFPLENALISLGLMVKDWLTLYSHFSKRIKRFRSWSGVERELKLNLNEVGSD